MDYKIVNDTIIETQTDYEIVKIPDPAQRKKIYRNLNFGGGFAGHTPAFFLKPHLLELPIDLSRFDLYSQRKN